jgi:ADP-ribose pyrophosphatase
MEDIQPWQKISESDIHKGYRHLARIKFKLPDNQMADFEIIKGGKIVCILAFTADKHILLAKQFRPGPGKILLDLPGGAVESNENPLEAAQRELQEETGYTGDLQLVTSSPVDAYATHERFHFIATDCHKVTDVNNDDHEFTAPQLLTLPEFVDHLRHGQLTDIATAYLGLDFLNIPLQHPS